jgi:putative nucleotidyltransferase with HDIG domain
VARRPSFLARFTLVLFASAALAAVLLAFVLDTAHRRAVESDQTLDALARVEAVFSPLVDRLEHGTVRQGELAAAVRASDVVGYVTGVRLYDDRGQALLAGAPSDVAAVRRALHAEDWFAIDGEGIRTVYAPLTTTDGRRTYVVAVVLSRGQMVASTGRERWVVIAATGGAILIVFASLLALAIGASRELERRRRESQATFVDALATFARMLDLRDPYTAGHSERVATYTRALATELRWSAEAIEVAYTGALLHDLGKIAVPDAILFKIERLTPSDRDAIELHPTVGAEILSGIGSLETIVPCVLHHHEHLDGSGYPHGLRGERIPAGARVIAVADAFDAMTTDRPYRRARTAAAAMQELQACAGTQFDPVYVAAFAALVARGAIVPPAPHEQPVFGRRMELDRLSG